VDERVRRPGTIPGRRAVPNLPVYADFRIGPIRTVRRMHIDGALIDIDPRLQIASTSMIALIQSGCYRARQDR
jgi:hypothetical protein